MNIVKHWRSAKDNIDDVVFFGGLVVAALLFFGWLTYAIIDSSNDEQLCHEKHGVYIEEDCYIVEDNLIKPIEVE